MEAKRKERRIEGRAKKNEEQRGEGRKTGVGLNALG
jgi:hypothetical protein